MYYEQSKTVRKLLETVIVFFMLFIIDLFMAADFRDIQPSPFLLIILLFSLRYGWKIGLVAFIFTLGYYVVAEVMAGGDMLLFFYNANESKWLLLYFFIAAIAGTMSTAWRERYDDLHFENQELQDSLASVKKAADQLTATNEILENRLLQAETSVASVYQMMRALDQDNLEIVTNEAASVLSSYFQAEAFGIYHVDSSKRALRIKVRLGNPESLPQTIFIDEAASFYERLFREKNVTVKRAGDAEAAPVIAGPIIIGGEIRQVLIIQKIDFYHMTEHNIQLLYWLLRIISDSAEKAAKKAAATQRRKLYPETNIYYKKYFDEYVEIERQRYTQYGQPYSVFELQIENVDHPLLVKISNVLSKHLREVDKVGLDLNEGRFSFLLPGTEEKYVEVLKKRISAKLQEEVDGYAGAK
ncbi:MAG: hypothetical protein ACE3JP_03710 [Ectobacillus sp.]